MPDPRKLIRAEAIGYSISPTCGNCLHARFNQPASEWGQCARATYEHAKHGERNLSINYSGTCPAHEFNPTSVMQLEKSGYDKFRREEIVEIDKRTLRQLGRAALIRYAASLEMTGFAIEGIVRTLIALLGVFREEDCKMTQMDMLMATNPEHRDKLAPIFEAMNAMHASNLVDAIAALDALDSTRATTALRVKLKHDREDVQAR